MLYEPDPKHLAGRSRLIRKLRGWTQENLADAAGVSTRTVEKLESGRHAPDEQTLKLIARGAGFDLGVFRKPSPEEEAEVKAAMERAKTKTDVLPIAPVKSASDVLSALQGSGAVRFDPSQVAGDEAMALAAEMQDWIDDVMLAWSDFLAVDQLHLARDFANNCERMRRLGFVCFAGRHKEKVYGTTLHVGVLCLIPAEREKDTKYAVVEMEGAWAKA